MLAEYFRINYKMMPEETTRDNTADSSLREELSTGITFVSCWSSWDIPLNLTFRAEQINTSRKEARAEAAHVKCDAFTLTVRAAPSHLAGLIVHSMRVPVHMWPLALPVDILERAKAIFTRPFCFLSGAGLHVLAHPPLTSDTSGTNLQFVHC